MRSEPMGESCELLLPCGLVSEFRGATDVGLAVGSGIAGGVGSEDAASAGHELERPPLVTVHARRDSGRSSEVLKAHG